MSTPVCRCRVLYLGCAVPKITKDGLQGIQDPLQDIYPEGGAADASGIDSWLSIWSNGMLLEYLDSMGLTITKFMPIETLHYCAAVRFVELSSGSAAASSSSEVIAMRFFPLDSPRAAASSPHHPPLFACIMRRTSGIKVLECHGFICKNEATANALVRACFHVYSDSVNLRLYEYIPTAVPVIIPKKKSIFKFGKKSRSKSLGPTLGPLRPPPALSVGSGSVSLDPYANCNYRIYTDWRTPTPRPIYLRTTPIHAPTPQLLKPVSADYRYANNVILSSSSSNSGNRDNNRKLRVWSGSHSAGGSEKDTYMYGNHYAAPLNHHLPQPARRRVSSRRSHNDSEYADVASVRNLRGKIGLNEDIYGSSLWQSPMTSYQPNGHQHHPPREQYHETTTHFSTNNVKSRKGQKSQEHEQTNVSYYRNNPMPYMTELERTLSNGQHLPRRNSGYKRYESMPDLNKISAKEAVHHELPGLMQAMRIRGSAGSAEHTSTGDTTPISTPATSLSDSTTRQERNRRRRSPLIPEADYYH